MDWVTSIHQAIQYIEEHLREELTIREIAQQAALSPFYFQKGFAMLCGMTVGDYIRQRRLSAAGLEVLTTDRKIIDTLTQILMGLLRSGFVLEAVEEAEPSAEMLDIPGMRDELRRPMMLLVRARAVH